MLINKFKYPKHIIMKKSITQLFIIVMLLIGLNSGIYAQGAFKHKDISFDLGLGLGTNFVAPGYKSAIPPIGLNFQYGFTGTVSGGAYLGYATSKFEAIGTNITVSYLILGIRGSYHHALNNHVDAYAGGMLGFNKTTATVEGGTGSGLSDVGIIFGGHLGAKYMLNDNFGAFGEIGYGIAYVTIGVSYKL